MTLFRPTNLLSFTGGYVDTLGFVALSGLFTAHVTGNFVTLGAAIVFGTGGILAKLLALPLFCLVVFAVRLAERLLARWITLIIPILLSVMLVLFSLAGGFATWHGPFREVDSLATIALGMLLVTAMAVQNAVHRAHMTKAPPTTLMTGTTTQIMIDLADMFSGIASANLEATRARLSRMAASLFSFAFGCITAAGLYIALHMASFLLPPVLVAIILVNRRSLQAELAA